jgi:hypothetical protein
MRRARSPPRPKISMEISRASTAAAGEKRGRSLKRVDGQKEKEKESGAQSARSKSEVKKKLLMNVEVNLGKEQCEKIVVYEGDDVNNLVLV